MDYKRKKRQQRAITRYDEASGGFKFGAGLKVDFILIQLLKVEGFFCLHTHLSIAPP